jgi:hypothetical protein
MIEIRLTAVSMKSAALYGAVVGFLVAYPCVGLMVFFQYFDPQRQTWPLGPWWTFLIAMPVGWAVVSSFLATCVCAAYNLSAKLFGGIRYTVCDDAADTK